MGFRFRKSIPIGKHFRINLSKSGVGYSCGIKGARFTKTANGKNRTTLSVPGTGISYTTESGTKAPKKKPSKKKPVNRKPASAKPQTTPEAEPQTPSANHKPTRSAFDIGSFKAVHPVWFWLIAISIWPISLSIWFLKTEKIKKLNKTARICLLVAFWSVFFLVGGIAGRQEAPKSMQLSDPISKITSIASPSPTVAPTPTPTPEPTPTPTPEPANTPAPEKAKPSVSQSRPQQGTQNSQATPGSTSGSGNQAIPQTSNKANYVLNTSTLKFHKPGCSYIPTENRKDVYDTRSNIVNQGYTPCGHCHP